MISPKFWLQRETVWVRSARELQRSECRVDSLVDRICELKKVDRQVGHTNWRIDMGNNLDLALHSVEVFLVLLFQQDRVL